MGWTEFLWTLMESIQRFFYQHLQRTGLFQRLRTDGTNSPVSVLKHCPLLVMTGVSFTNCPFNSSGGGSGLGCFRTLLNNGNRVHRTRTQRFYWTCLELGLVTCSENPQSRRGPSGRKSTHGGGGVSLGPGGPWSGGPRRSGGTTVGSSSKGGGVPLETLLLIGPKTLHISWT